MLEARKGRVNEVSPIVVFMLAVHVIASIGMVVFVLLHSGKGTGVSSMFGAVQSAVSGTSVIEKNLDRITIGFAVAYFVSALILMVAYKI